MRFCTIESSHWKHVADNCPVWISNSLVFLASSGDAEGGCGASINFPKWTRPQCCIVCRCASKWCFQLDWRDYCFTVATDNGRSPELLNHCGGRESQNDRKSARCYSLGRQRGNGILGLCELTRVLSASFFIKKSGHLYRNHQLGMLAIFKVSLTAFFPTFNIFNRKIEEFIPKHW